MKRLTVGEFYKLCKQEHFDAYIYEYKTKTREIIAEFDGVDIKLDPLGDFLCFKLSNKVSLDFRWVKYIDLHNTRGGEYEFLIVCEEFDDDCKPNYVRHKISAIKC